MLDLVSLEFSKSRYGNWIEHYSFQPKYDLIKKKKQKCGIWFSRQIVPERLDSGLAVRILVIDTLMIVDSHVERVTAQLHERL
jgi:hypothetical protein